MKTIYNKQNEEAFWQFIKRENLRIVDRCCKGYREEYAPAVQERQGTNGAYYTHGKIYHVFGNDFHYEQNGCSSFNNLDYAFEAAYKFAGIRQRKIS